MSRVPPRLQHEILDAVQPVTAVWLTLVEQHIRLPVRTGIYELLVLDDELRAAVIEQRSAGHLRRLGLSRGMRTLRDDGLRLVRAGITTVEEVLRVADVGGE